MRFKIANISRVRPYLSQDTAKMITDSLVTSTISYMATLYLRLPSNQKKIQILMNTAARVVLQAEPRSHVVDLLRELYWLNSKNLYEYQLLCVLRRLRMGRMKAKVTFGEIFGDWIQLWRLRSQHLRVNWRRIRSHGRNSFAFMAVTAYNHFELNSRYFEDEEDFKRTAKFKVFTTRPNGNIN